MTDDEKARLAEIREHIHLEPYRRLDTLLLKLIDLAERETQRADENFASIEELGRILKNQIARADRAEANVKELDVVMTDEKVRLAEIKANWYYPARDTIISRSRAEVHWLIETLEKYGAELRRVAPYLANHRFPGYTYTDGAHTRRTDARD